MLTVNELVGFLTTTDYEKARAFYGGKLGFEFVSLDQFALAMRAGKNMIRISKAETFKPAQGSRVGSRRCPGRCVVAQESRRGDREVWIRRGSRTGDLDRTFWRSGGMVQGSRRERSFHQPPRLRFTNASAFGRQ
jgi:hypothetical protein